MAEEFDLIEATGCDELLEQVYRLRVVSWSSQIHLPQEFDRWEDREDSASRHWVVLSGGRVVAAGRLTVVISRDELPDASIYRPLNLALTPPIGSLNRLVVSPQARGRGLPFRLDRVRLEAAVEEGCHCVIGSVDRKSRAKALKSYGFMFVGAGDRFWDGPLRGTSNDVYLLDLNSSYVLDV